MSDHSDLQRPARTVRVVIGSDLDDLVAMKTGSNPVAVIAIEREALVLSQVRHPNVVDLLRTERAEGTATLVTQFAGRNTLGQYQPIDAAAVARLGASLLTIVGELHDLGWVHGRLTEDHCIVGGGGRITLCAFGAAHRSAPGDPRRSSEIADAIAIISSLANRLVEPSDRAGKRRHRALGAALDAGDPTPAGAERLRNVLGELGGAASIAPAHSVPVAAPQRIDDATRRSVRRHPAPRKGDTTRPAQRHRLAAERPPRWKGMLASTATLVFLLAVVALLRWLGGPLDGSSASGVRRLGDVPAPIALALSVVRFAAFAACLYGIVLAAATLAAVVTRRPDIERLATRLAPPRVRRLLVAVIGVGILASVASGPSTASSTTARSGTSLPTSPDAQQSTAGDHRSGSLAAISADRLDPQDHDTPVAQPPTAEPETTLPNLWVMESGDHLWRVADTALSAHLGRQATEREIDVYWHAVIDLNRSSLIDPDNPDLVFTGQVIELPPL